MLSEEVKVNGYLILHSNQNTVSAVLPPLRLDTNSLALQPLQRPRIVLQKRRNLIPHLPMIVVQPLLLRLRQQRGLHELRVDRAPKVLLVSRLRSNRQDTRNAHGDILKPKIPLVPKVVRGLSLLNE